MPLMPDLMILGSKSTVDEEKPGSCCQPAALPGAWRESSHQGSDVSSEGHTDTFKEAKSSFKTDGLFINTFRSLWRYQPTECFRSDTGAMSSFVNPTVTNTTTAIQLRDNNSFMCTTRTAPTDLNLCIYTAVKQHREITPFKGNLKD